MAKRKPILCLDFDGVIHSYTSGWEGADIISDPPVPGTLEAIKSYMEFFEIHIFSSRSHQEGGKEAMQYWLSDRILLAFGLVTGQTILDAIIWPDEKPPAMITIDDRALTFTGVWPDLEELKQFRPWNK